MTWQRGLVVGKFSPLHRGHQILIERARAECDEIIIISYAKPEFPGCGAEVRRTWLATLYPDAVLLVVDDAWLAARSVVSSDQRFPVVPPDDAPEDEHRRFTAWLCRDVLGRTCDAVFTSEDYGDGFAKVLAQEFGHPVTHVCVDKARAAVPVSATAIRRDAGLRERYLDPLVNRTLPLRVLFLGAESTGKTSLCRLLGARWGEPVAEEYGRELWVAKDGKLEFDDMLAIGKAQVEREERLLREAKRALVCDTSPLTTLSFSYELFGSADPALVALADRAYDRVFLCMPDFPLVQDGTRQDEEFRARQHAFYIAELSRRGIPFVTLAGSAERRFRIIVDSSSNYGSFTPIGET